MPGLDANRNSEFDPLSFRARRIEAFRASEKYLPSPLFNAALLPIGLFYWLRSRGIAVAAMAGDADRDAYRLHYDSLADEANGLTGVRSIFGRSIADLHAVRGFLSTPGRALMIAIDVPEGSRPAALRLDESWLTVQLGAFSFATMTNAVVLPCLYRAAGGMGCEIFFGQPVPDELLATRKSYSLAAQHILNQLLPQIRQTPEQSDLLLLKTESGESIR